MFLSSNLHLQGGGVRENPRRDTLPFGVFLRAIPPNKNTEVTGCCNPRWHFFWWSPLVTPASQNRARQKEGTGGRFGRSILRMDEIHSAPPKRPWLKPKLSLFVFTRESSCQHFLGAGFRPSTENLASVQANNMSSMERQGMPAAGAYPFDSHPNHPLGPLGTAAFDPPIDCFSKCFRPPLWRETTDPFAPAQFPGLG